MNDGALSTEQLAVLLSRQIEVSALGKKTDSYDLLHMANVVAAFESAQYHCERMTLARNFTTNLELLKHAMSIRTIDGLILEFGVASGTTINCMASQTGLPIHGFDTFTGLPEAWRTGYPAGMFARPKPEVPRNVELIAGKFEDTLEPFLDRTPGPASMIHVDCDLYSSTKAIFACMRERIVPGTVIVFDEYFNYPGWKRHEFLAFQEFLSTSGRSYKYEGFVSRHQQVCVVIH